MQLPLAVIERIMRNAGASSVSENAVVEMRESSQDIVEEIVEDAADIARKEGREIITVEDVEKALET